MRDNERARVNYLLKECDFFSNKGKQERERWIATKFLSLLGNFSESKVEMPPEHGLVDFIYNEGNQPIRFEIKVINNTFLRNKDNRLEIENDNITGAYKALRLVLMKFLEDDSFCESEINRALNNQLIDKNGNYRAFDKKNEDGYSLVLKEAEHYTKKYTSKGKALEMNGTDLLLYCLRSHVSRINNSKINHDDFKNLGWRSVSCLMGDEAIVLYTSDEGPHLLRNNRAN